jgi:hypothetical protein
MINKIILKSLIDPDNPDKALEYLEQNMTEKEYIDWITEKIIDQKDNEVIKLPITIMFNIFMDYIQDACQEPYDIFKDHFEDNEPVNIYFKDYSEVLNNQKWSKEYFFSLTQDILKKHNGSAKKFKFTGNLYAEKKDTDMVDLFLPEKLVDIDDFVFAKED